MFTVVQCVNNIDVGGLEQLVLSLARQLRHNGYRSLICCMENKGALADQAEKDGIGVHSLQMTQKGKWRAFADYRRLLQEHRPAVIHSHNFKPFYYSALATLSGASNGHVHTRHGAFIQQHRALWRYRLLKRGVDTIVSVAYQGREELARIAGISTEEVVVLWNGIDTDKFRPSPNPTQVRAELGLPANVRPIICVARLSPEKDLATLLRAFAIVRRDVPKAELWLVGDGVERSPLIQLARELDIQDWVRFLGQRNDIPQLLRAADVFALSSLTEGLSIALIEAAASGLPIVATDVGGNREIVNPPTGGRLVATRDSSALAAALREVLINDTLHHQMACANRQQAVEKLSLTKMVAGYEALYQQALQHHQ